MDTSDKMAIFVAILYIAFICLIIWLATAPCSDFSQMRITSLPVRCLPGFNSKLP